MILDLDIGNTLSKWRLKDSDSSEIRSRGAVWTREEWKPGSDIPDLDVVESVRISSVARQAVLEALQECEAKGITSWNYIKGVIKDTLKNYIWQKTKRSPMILPIIMEV